MSTIRRFFINTYNLYKSTLLKMELLVDYKNFSSADYLDRVC